MLLRAIFGKRKFQHDSWQVQGRGINPRTKEVSWLNVGMIVVPDDVMEQRLIVRVMIENLDVDLTAANLGALSSITSQIEDNYNENGYGIANHRDKVFTEEDGV